MFRERLEAVTVCVGYGDFLAATAPHNAPHFDRWVVVTHPDDTETREVCRRHHLVCVTTRDVDRDGPFSKGRLVERGLQHLGADGWCLHIDADIVLPARYRHELERAHLRSDAIYGADRFMVKGWDDWVKLVNSGWLHSPFDDHPHCVRPPAGYEIGSRWANADGWVPIGHNQLWNRTGGQEEWRGHRAKSYPLNHANACRTDVQFSLFFDRRDRILLPELFVAHLESEACRTGTNWRGRKTRRFGPPGHRHQGNGPS